MSTHIDFLEELNQLVSDAGYEDIILITETDDNKVLKLSWDIDQFKEEERGEASRVIRGALTILLNSEKYSDIKLGWLPPQNL